MISEVHAMASPPKDGGQSAPGLGQMLFPMVIVFAIFYFLILRPQKKKESTHKKFLDEIKRGDEVITNSGIHGRVSNIADAIITLEVADKVKIRISKNAIAGYQAPAQERK